MSGLREALMAWVYEQDGKAFASKKIAHDDKAPLPLRHLAQGQYDELWRVIEEINRLIDEPVEPVEQARDAVGAGLLSRRLRT